MAIKTPEIDLRSNFGKNYIINGDFQIAQRNSTFTSPASAAYLLDRWQYINGTTATHTVTQDGDAPTLAQAGHLITSSMRFNLTAADNSIAAGDLCLFRQKIEGYNFLPIAQRKFTLSFWVKATLAGVYCVAFRNNGSDRSFVAQYTINASNTWEKKSITVEASPSAGTWNYSSSIGLFVEFILAAGTTYHTTAGVWQTSDPRATSSQVNGVGTGATDFRITAVMINDGLEALPFRLFGGDTEGERAACYRYYVQTNPGGHFRTSGSAYLSIRGVGTGNWSEAIQHSVVMRAVPSVTVDTSGTSSGINDGGTAVGNNTTAGFGYNINANGSPWVTGLPFIADAEL